MPQISIIVSNYGAVIFEFNYQQVIKFIFISIHEPFIFYYFVLWPTNAHNYFTNYHTATCFDTIVSSSGSL